MIQALRITISLVGVQMKTNGSVIMIFSPVRAQLLDPQLVLTIKAMLVVQMVTNYVKHQMRAPLNLLPLWTTMLTKPCGKSFVIMLNMDASEWIKLSLPHRKKFWSDASPVVSQLINIQDPPRSVSKFFLNNFILTSTWELWLYNYVQNFKTNIKSATFAKKAVWPRNMVVLIGTIM